MLCDCSHAQQLPEVEWRPFHLELKSAGVKKARCSLFIRRHPERMGRRPPIADGGPRQNIHTIPRCERGIVWLEVGAGEQFVYAD